MPEPGPVGVSVVPLGEALGPRVLPEGLAVLFGVVVVAPVPVVLPLVEEPVVVLPAAEPPAAELPPAVPPAEPPPLCASPKVLDSASAVANAMTYDRALHDRRTCAGVQEAVLASLRPGKGNRF
jgi:hypothetical protein